MRALAIIKTELWQRRISLIWWSVGVAAMVGIDMSFYATVKNDAAALNQALTSLPNTVKALFAGGADFLTPAGYLSARVYYLLLPLLLTIFTIGVGGNLIGKEERQGTLEFLLARPVSRLKLLLSKATAGGIAIGILGFVALVTGLICLRPSGFDTMSLKIIVLVTVNAVALSVVFGMIAFCLSALGGRFRGMATPVAALVAFGSYLLSSLETMASWLVWPARLLPYHYYNPNAILNGTSYGFKPLLGFVCAIIALLVAAWIGFRRRDIG
ncbi:MAG TPA: ABC transporter permease subunit [Patescibacteria group bacterium]|nr:ABC transporter permease subunit [Patescibacteria group bacterium]